LLESVESVELVELVRSVELVEVEKPIEVATNTAAGIKIISRPTNRFYVIIASFQSENDARNEAKKHLQSVGSRVHILKNNQGQYRVSIMDYENLEEAKKGKETYKATFSGAWILNY